MPVADLRVGPASCPGGCHDRGVCNSLGHCHCDVGYGGPGCMESGPGGSTDSGPASGPGESIVGEVLGAVCLSVFLLALLVLLFVYLRNRGDLRRLVEKTQLTQRGADSPDAAEKKRRMEISGPLSAQVNGHSGGSSPTHALLPRVDTATTVASQQQRRESEAAVDPPGSGDEGGEVAVVTQSRSFFGFGAGTGGGKKHSASDVEGGGGRERLGFVQSLARSITFPASLGGKPRGEKAARYEIKVEKRRPKEEEDQETVASPLEEVDTAAAAATKDSAGSSKSETVQIVDPTPFSPPKKPPTPKRPVSTSLASPDKNGGPDFKSNPKLAFPHSSSFTSTGVLRSPFLPSSKLAFNTSHLSSRSSAGQTPTTEAAAVTTTTAAAAPTTITTTSSKPVPPPVAKKPTIVTAATDSGGSSSVTTTTTQIVSPVTASAKPVQSPFFKKSTAAAATATTTTTTTTASSSQPDLATTAASSSKDGKGKPPPLTLTKTSTLPTSLANAATSGGQMPKSSTLPLNATSPTGQQPPTQRPRPEISKPVLQTATDSAASLIEKAPSTGVSQSSILATAKERRAAAGGGHRGVVFCDPLTLPSPTNPNNPPIIHQPHLTGHLPVSKSPTSAPAANTSTTSKAAPVSIVTPTWTKEPKALTSDAVICHIDEEEGAAAPAKTAAAAPAATTSAGLAPPAPGAPIASPEPDASDRQKSSPTPSSASSTSTLTHGGSSNAPPGRGSFRGLEISAPILQSSVNLKTKLVPICAPADTNAPSGGGGAGSPRSGSPSSGVTSPVPTRTAPPPPIAPRGRPRSAGSSVRPGLQAQQSFPAPAAVHAPSSTGTLPKQTSLDDSAHPPPKEEAKKPFKSSRRVPVPWLRSSKDKEEKEEKPKAAKDKLKSSSSFSSSSRGGSRPASIATTRPVRPSAPPPMPPPDRVSPSPTLGTKEASSSSKEQSPHIYDTIKESSCSPEKEVKRATEVPLKSAAPSNPPKPAVADR